MMRTAVFISHILHTVQTYHEDSFIPRIKGPVCKIYRDLLAEYGRNKIFMLSLVYNELKIRFVVFFIGLE